MLFGKKLLFNYKIRLIVYRNFLNFGGFFAESVNLQMKFLKKIEKFIADNSLLVAGKPLLVGFSGGADSVVLADTLLRLGYQVALAHCNFHLRGEDSVQDQRFVERFAERRGLRLFVTEFQTVEEAKKRGISIEMAARELRYEWFERLTSEHDFQAIAIAHHRNDQAETILLNLARGTGLAGLSGIRAKRDKIVRPLLCVNHSEIMNYIEERGLEFCTDRTNADTRYHRNRLRHNVVPQLEELNPRFVDSMQSFSEQMCEYNDFFQQKISEELQQVVENRDDKIFVNFQKLQATGFERIFLFETVRKAGFPASMFSEIYKLRDSEVGRWLSYQDLVVARDRGGLLIYTEAAADEKVYEVSLDSSDADLPLPLRLSVIERSDLKTLKTSPNVALLDVERLNFPLKLRLWRAGDSFQPFGMQGRRKLSDFLKDQKLNPEAKRNTWVLLSEGEIAWVVGQRISNSFALAEGSKRVLKIELLK